MQYAIPASQYDRLVQKLTEVILFVLLGLGIAYLMYSNNRPPFLNDGNCVCPVNRDRDNDRPNRDRDRPSRGSTGDTTSTGANVK